MCRGFPATAAGDLEGCWRAAGLQLARHCRGGPPARSVEVNGREKGSRPGVREHFRDF